MVKPLPSTQYLHEALSYDPATGVLTWRERPLRHFSNKVVQHRWNGKLAGKTAGCPKSGGYIHVSIEGRRFDAHRLIRVIQTGEWPKIIDHKDGNTANNRWENLREATMQQNCYNAHRRVKRELPRGVYGDRGRFMVIARIAPKPVYLGSFRTPDEAHAAWRAAVQTDRAKFFRP